MNELHTARHAVPEAAAELEQFDVVASSCRAMAARLTEWLADEAVINMLVYGYRGQTVQFPEGAHSPSDVLNTLRNVRDALKDAVSMMSDAE